MILNLSKSLEALFPPAGDGKTRDAARDQLRSLGYSDSHIERAFIPAMALRNEIDVGHVELAVFTRQQLVAIHAYTEAAESNFRDLFKKIFKAITDGTWSVPEYKQSEPSKGALEVVQRLVRALHDN